MIERQARKGLPLHFHVVRGGQGRPRARRAIAAPRSRNTYGRRGPPLAGQEDSFSFVSYFVSLLLSWAKGRPAPGPGGTCAAERRDGRRALGVGPPGWAGELFSGPIDLEKARPAHMGSEQAVGDTALAAGQHLLLGVGPLQALGLCGRWVLCGGELWSGGLDFSREPYRGPIQPPGSRASGSERVCLWALGVGWTLHGRWALGVG